MRTNAVSAYILSEYLKDCSSYCALPPAWWWFLQFSDTLSGILCLSDNERGCEILRFCCASTNCTWGISVIVASHWAMDLQSSTQPNAVVGAASISAVQHAALLPARSVGILCCRRITDDWSSQHNPAILRGMYEEQSWLVCCILCNPLGSSTTILVFKSAHGRPPPPPRRRRCCSSRVS